MPVKGHIRLRWEEGSETSKERMWEAVPYTFALQFRLPNFLEPPPSACGTLSVWDDNSSSFAGWAASHDGQWRPGQQPVEAGVRG